MKNILRTISLFALALSASVFQLASQAQAAGIVWNDDLGMAMQTAKREGKPLFVEFWSPYCSRCAHAEKTVFSDPQVQAATRNFVMVRADVTKEKGNRAMLLLKMSSVSMPDVQIFNREGKPVYHQAEQLDATQLLGVMKQASAGSSKTSSDDSSFGGTNEVVRWDMKEMLGLKQIGAADKYDGNYMLTEYGVELLDSRPRTFFPARQAPK